MTHPTRDLLFDALQQPVEMRGCTSVKRGLQSVLRGWELLESDRAPEPPPLARLEEDGKRIRYWSAHHGKTYRYRCEVDAVCALVADLIRAYLRSDPARLCLHCGAAEFEGKLVVFTGHHRGGKSTLASAMAAAGKRVYCDDVLPIEGPDDFGNAPGFAPRLRLPYPENLSPEIRRFFESNAGPTGRRYQYLDLPPELLASRGDQAPIGAALVLDRQSEGPAELIPLDEGEALRELIRGNFGRDERASGILERFHGVVADAACYSLRYSRVQDAIALLEERFSEWPSPEGAASIAVPVTPAEPRPVEGAREPHLARNGTARRQGVGSGLNGHANSRDLYRRNPEIATRDTGQELFLIDSTDEVILHLNVLGRAVWNLLEAPTSLGDVHTLLSQAFPDVDAHEIDEDLRRVVRRMRTVGLVEGPL